MAHDLKPVYLITGSDRPKIGTALKRLRARFDENAVELLSAAETSGEAVVAACNALGLFGGADEGRLIVVDAIDGHRNDDGRLVGGWKAADLKAVSAYVEQPAPGTVLALVGEEVKLGSPLGKACKKVGDVLAFEVAKRGLAKWVGEQFARRGATVDAAVCQALVDLVGDDPLELENEIDKLATWAGGEAIGEHELRTLTATRADTAIFDLTDAWGRRDTAAVLAACEARLEHGDDPLRLLGALAGHIDRIAQCQAWIADGLSSKEAAAKLKRHPFYAQKLYAQAGNYSADELREAVVRLAALDLALKGGSRLSGELELERALVDVTRAAEPAATG